MCVFWSDYEIRELLSVRAEDVIKRQISGTAKDAVVYGKITDILHQRGIMRRKSQVISKLKSLRKKFLQMKSHLGKSSGRLSWPYYQTCQSIWGSRSVSPADVLTSSQLKCEEDTSQDDPGSFSPAAPETEEDLEARPEYSLQPPKKRLKKVSRIPEDMQKLFADMDRDFHQRENLRIQEQRQYEERLRKEEREDMARQMATWREVQECQNNLLRELLSRLPVPLAPQPSHQPQENPGTNNANTTRGLVFSPPSSSVTNPLNENMVDHTDELTTQNHQQTPEALQRHVKAECDADGSLDAVGRASREKSRIYSGGEFVKVGPFRNLSMCGSPGCSGALRALNESHESLSARISLLEARMMELMTQSPPETPPSSNTSPRSSPNSTAPQPQKEEEIQASCVVAPGATGRGPTLLSSSANSMPLHPKYQTEEVEQSPSLPKIQVLTRDGSPHFTSECEESLRSVKDLADSYQSLQSRVSYLEAQMRALIQTRSLPAAGSRSSIRTEPVVSQATLSSHPHSDSPQPVLKQTEQISPVLMEIPTDSSSTNPSSEPPGPQLSRALRKPESGPQTPLSPDSLPPHVELQLKEEEIWEEVLVENLTPPAPPPLTIHPPLHTSAPDLWSL